MLWCTAVVLGGIAALALAFFAFWFFCIKGKDTDSKDGDQFMTKPPVATYQKQGSANSNGSYNDVGAVRDVGTGVAGELMVQDGAAGLVPGVEPCNLCARCSTLL